MNYQGYNEFKRAYIAKFNEMEQELRKPELSPQLQVLINLELQQKEQEKQLAIVSEKVENIKEIVALSPTEWRKETTALLNKIAKILGITTRAYQTIESGKSDSRPKVWDKLEDLLNLPQRQLREVQKQPDDKIGLR